MDRRQGTGWGGVAEEGRRTNEHTGVSGAAQGTQQSQLWVEEADFQCSMRIPQPASKPELPQPCALGTPSEKQTPEQQQSREQGQ